MFEQSADLWNSKDLRGNHLLLTQIFPKSYNISFEIFLLGGLWSIMFQLGGFQVSEFCMNYLIRNHASFVIEIYYDLIFQFTFFLKNWHFLNENLYGSIKINWILFLTWLWRHFHPVYVGRNHYNTKNPKDITNLHIIC